MSRMGDRWLEAALDSLSEVATTTLGVDAPTVRATVAPRGRPGP